MIINFDQIEHDTYGRIEQPILQLRTLSDRVVCLLSNTLNLKMNLKFNQVSEVTFNIPAQVGGVPTPNYHKVTGQKIVQIDPYGKFVLFDPEISNDGIKEIKTCTCKSLECQLDNKNIVIGKGTYSFFNPASPNNTIMDMILERVPDWSVGTIDPLLVGKYRTFDNVDANLLDFTINTLQELYNCVFVFDTYEKTISVRAAQSDTLTVPVYLSHQNLIKNANIRELSSNIVTALSVHGADPVSIRNVNPTGNNVIYNLDYFIANGDISKSLAEKWRLWQTNLKSAQQSYTNILTLKNSCTAQYIAETARLKDIEAEHRSLENLRATIIQGMANKLKPQEDLDAVNAKILAQDGKIKAQTELLTSIKSNSDEYTAQLLDINKSSALSTFFLPTELQELSQYFIESSFTDSTFALVESGSFASGGTTQNAAQAVVSIENSKITTVPVPPELGKTILQLTGGSLSIPLENAPLSAEIISSTLECKNNKDCVWSFYLGAGTVNKEPFPSGNLTLICKAESLPSNIGGSLSLPVSNLFAYFTRNVSEYQTFSVEKELLDYATEILQDKAEPSYEFDIDSCNFIFLKEFAPFKDVLQLGSAVYLQLNDGLCIKPALLEVNLDFQDPSKFNMVFSNEFKRPDSLNWLRKVIKKTSATARTVDFNKYNYGSFTDSNAKGEVYNFMTSAINAAANAILAGENQNIVLDQTGFKALKYNPDGTVSPNQVAINNNQIALTNDAWKTAMIGIGEFYDKTFGSCYGVCAPNIIGTLLVGQNLVIESLAPDGKTMQFKVDSSGAFLNNSQFLVQSDNGGQVAIDPSFGLAIGGGVNKPLYSFDDKGKIQLNKENAKLYTDLNGNLHSIGNITANNLYFNDGGDIKTLLSEAQKAIPSQYLSLYGLTIKHKETGVPTLEIDNAGNLKMHSGSISWDTPVLEYQYSVDGKTNWHATESGSDKYRRERQIGGEWGAGYQYKAADGRPGSDASVPGYIKSTYIDQTEIRSPTIKANVFSVYPKDETNYTGAFNLYGMYGSGVEPYHFLEVAYSDSGLGTPEILFDSPGGASARWGFGTTYFGYGSVDFGSCSQVTFGKNAPTAVFG